MPSDLDKIRVVISTLTDDPVIYIARFGKDPRLALDKREAEADVMTALVQWFEHRGMESHDFSIAGRNFTLELSEVFGAPEQEAKNAQ